LSTSDDKLQGGLQRLIGQLDAALPQTQCTRCGYPDCASYARAIASGEAGINQCPPGGEEGVRRLAATTGRAVLPLSAEHGIEGPRTLAVIDEDWCIGCTRCLKVCPTDAIVGGNKLMHTVIERWCTGCELCIPACPVDCIELVDASPGQTGWDAWSERQAEQARERYRDHVQRQAREEVEHRERQEAKALHKLENLAEHSRHTEPELLDRKRALIEAALARSRAARQQKS
jgi:Na+-translocating ferredoxin:NAD+ oxidoreductase subunit B